MPERALVILALPASQYCIGGLGKTTSSAVNVGSSKRQKTDFCAYRLLFEWDKCEQLLHYKYVNASATDAPETYQIPWLVPPVSGGLNRELMNSEAERSSILTPTPLQQHASTKNGKNGTRNHSRNCTTIVPHSSSTSFPSSSFTENAPSVIAKTKSLLAAVSNYVNSSSAGKRRHGTEEKGRCCLCHADATDPAIKTLEELKAFVRKDVAEMMHPIWNGISSLKTDLQNSCRQQPREQPLALQMVSGDVHIPKDGVFLNPEVLIQQGKWKQNSTTSDPQVLGKLPNLFVGNCTELQDQTDKYSKTLQEKDQEIQALQATVFDLVDYQQKITVQLEKLQESFLMQVKRRPSSFPDGRPTLYLDLLASSCTAAFVSLDSFTAHFVSYSESRFHVPANKIWKPNFRNAYLTREDHWTYALKAFFCERMFVGFENETYMTDAASLHLDPAKLRKESYEYFQRATSPESSSSCESAGTDPHFKIFCEQKFDSILPGVLLLQPDDYDADNMIESSFPTKTEINLSQSFTAAAMKVWTLHKLCFSFEPAASIFRARRGREVDWNYMESVVRLEDDKMYLPKVGFMISPGFRLRDSIIKSQVYLAGRAKVSHVGIHGHHPMHS